jgi:hypothetical protein
MRLGMYGVSLLNTEGHRYYRSLHTSSFSVLITKIVKTRNLSMYIVFSISVINEPKLSVCSERHYR